MTPKELFEFFSQIMTVERVEVTAEYVRVYNTRSSGFFSFDKTRLNSEAVAGEYKPEKWRPVEMSDIVVGKAITVRIPIEEGWVKAALVGWVDGKAVVMEGSKFHFPARNVQIQEQ